MACRPLQDREDTDQEHWEPIFERKPSWTKRTACEPPNPFIRAPFGSATSTVTASCLGIRRGNDAATGFNEAVPPPLWYGLYATADIQIASDHTESGRAGTAWESTLPRPETWPRTGQHQPISRWRASCETAGRYRNPGARSIVGRPAGVIQKYPWCVESLSRCRFNSRAISGTWMTVPRRVMVSLAVTV